MRLLSARLIVSLIVGVTLVSLCTSYYQVFVQNRGLQKDLQRRAEVLGESLARNVERDLERDAQHNLQRTVQQYANRDHLAGLAVYDPQGHPIAVTKSIEPLMANARAVAIVLQALKENHDADTFLRIGSASLHIYALPLHQGDELIGSLAIVHDSGYIRQESLRIWRETFLSALAHVVLIVLITLLIVRWSIAGPIARTAHWMKALRTGRGAVRIKVAGIGQSLPLEWEALTVHNAADPLDDGTNPLGREPRFACKAVYYNLYINEFFYRVNPCCYLQQVPGFEEVRLDGDMTFMEGWNSPGMVELRRRLAEGPLFGACMRCPEKW